MSIVEQRRENFTRASAVVNRQLIFAILLFLNFYHAAVSVFHLRCYRSFLTKNAL